MAAPDALPPPPGEEGGGVRLRDAQLPTDAVGDELAAGDETADRLRRQPEARRNGVDGMKLRR